MLNAFIIFQYCIPKQVITVLAGALANRKSNVIKNPLIRMFIRYFNIDMNDAIEQNPTQYQSFNDFFTRQLKPNSRPISAAEKDIISPADGEVAAFGTISSDLSLTIKHRSLNIPQLLASEQLAKDYIDGQFIVVYLSPKDYHRVHTPIASSVESATYIPGKLFSVNLKTVEGIEGVFAKNERLRIGFKGATPYQYIMVGALIVAGMKTKVTGRIKRQSAIKDFSLANTDKTDYCFEKGEEFGQFDLGSTVVLLFPKNSVTFNDDLHEGLSVKMGEKIAVLNGMPT